MAKKKVVLVIGRTGSGKATVVKGVCERMKLKQMRFNPSHEAGISSISKGAIDEADICVVPPSIVNELKIGLENEFDFPVIYIRAPKEVVMQRVKERNNEDGFLTQFESENAVFTEFEKSMKWDYHILNNRTLDDAIVTMEKMLKKELNR